MRQSLYNILAHGTDADIDGYIYRNDEMSPSATSVCTGVLTHHFRAPSQDAQLIEKAIVTNGCFSMLIVLPSWKPDSESNYIPLIVKDLDGNCAIAGVMMPFNDLAPHLDEDDEDIGKLTAEWIVRKAQTK